MDETSNMPLVTGTSSDVTHSRADLMAENAMLRQPLILLNRQVERPQLTNWDRIRLVLLTRYPSGSQEHGLGDL